MGIELGSNFDVKTGLPLDSRTKVANQAARDAIASGIRYEGMIVYVVADGTNYQLIGGILNANWEELSGGGGGGTVTTLNTLTGGATITIAPDVFDQTFVVEASAAAISLASVPFDISGGALDGTVVMLIGSDDTKTVTVSFNDASGGCIGNFDSVTLYKGLTAKFKLITALSRWIYVG